MEKLTAYNIIAAVCDTGQKSFINMNIKSDKINKTNQD